MFEPHILKPKGPFNPDELSANVQKKGTVVRCPLGKVPQTTIIKPSLLVLVDENSIKSTHSLTISQSERVANITHVNEVFISHTFLKVFIGTSPILEIRVSLPKGESVIEITHKSPRDIPRVKAQNLIPKIQPKGRVRLSIDKTNNTRIL